MRHEIVIPVVKEPLFMIANVAYARVPYWYGMTGRELYLHIIKPKHKKEPRPLVVWFCGGAYTVMDPALHCPDLKYLAEEGYIVASVQYRVPCEGAFPAPVEDAKAAIRYLRAHAEEFDINPARVAVMGESAGAHLALMAAVMEDPSLEVGDWKEQSSAVQAVVDWYGPTRRYDDAGFSQSPMDYLTDHTPPMLILHGDRDELVPFSDSELLYDALQKNGTEAELWRIEEAGHGDLHFTQPEMEKIILQFLDTHLK